MTNFTTPVGRFVSGSITKPQTTDAEGRPLVFKTGADTGKPRPSYFIAIAIPKTGEAHWNQTVWGAVIWKEGHTAPVVGAQADHPSFAWKIEDGDSTIPHKSKDPNIPGRKNCETPGYPGNWIIKFSSSFPSSTYNANGSAKIEPESIKLGYFIQINGDVEGNKSMQQPGIYLNHKMIALAAYGEEIVYGPDAAEAGFGASPLPAGAMSTPPAGFVPPVAPAAPAPAPMAPAAPAAPAPAMAPPPPPAPAFLQVPPPAAPAHQMLPPANGATYEQMIAAGWTDVTLRQMGMMT